MKTIWFWIAFTLSISDVLSEIKEIKLRVFPANTIAGVFQVSYLNELNQPEYAFNTTDARDLCLSLGVNIATKDQVMAALNRGLETCRFGWIDEHFVVIPRVKALSNCGQNQTGLVKWRAAVTRKFDVFCFNESASQLEAENWILESAKNPTLPPFLNIFNFSLPSDLSLLDSLDGVELARVVGGEQSSGKGKVVLITSACAILLLAIAVFAYFKIRKRNVHRADVNQKRDYMEAKEWTSVKIAEKDDKR